MPINGDALLSGSLEPTNEWCAVAKIAGIKRMQSHRCQHGRDFNTAMPTNLYGPGDNFTLSTSHFKQALVRKAHEAKLQRQIIITVWRTGTPLRNQTDLDPATG